MKRSSGEHFFNNWQIKIVCFLLAIIVFALVSFSSRGTRKVTVPLSVILPEKYEATSIIPDSVTLVIEGREDSIYMIDPEAVSVSADFSRVSKEGVASSPVIITINGIEEYLDISRVALKTDPQNVRIYFEEK